MELIRTNPPTPEDSKVNDVMKGELELKYADVEKRRYETTNAFLGLIALIQNNKPVSDLHRAAIIRSLARYVDARSTYDALWKGEIPRSQDLPEYLSPYVRTPEDEEFVLKGTEMILPLQYDVARAAQLTESPSQLEGRASEILVSAVRMRLSMRYVEACIQETALVKDNAPFTQLLEATGYAKPQGAESYPQEDIDAMRLVVGFLLKNRDALQRYANITGSGNIADLTIADALESSISAYPLGSFAQEIAKRAPEILRGNIPDLRDITANVMDEAKTKSEQLTLVALAPLSELDDSKSPEDRAAFRRNAEAVVGFLNGFEGKRVTLKNAEPQIQHMNDAQKKMVWRMGETLRKQEALQTLERALFIPGNQEARSDLDTQAAKAVRDLVLQGDLTLQEAFKLYYLVSLKSGVTVPLTYELLRVLEEHGQRELATNLQYRAFRTVTDLALSKAENFSADLKELGVTPEQAVELQNIREYLKESGIDAVGSFWNKLWAWYTYFPEIAIPTTAIGASGLGTPAYLLGRKAFITAQITKLEKFVEHGVAKTKALYGLSNIPDERIALAQQELTKILSQHDRLSQRFHLFRGRKLRKTGKMLLRAGQSGELDDMAKALAQYGNANDVETALRTLTDDADEIRAAMRRAGIKLPDPPPSPGNLSSKPPTRPGGDGPNRMGGFGKKMMIIGAIGAGLDLMDLAQAHAAEQANKEKERTATDADLRNFYHASNDLLRAGTIMQGVEVITIAGGPVMLPVRLATEAVRYTRNELERSVEFWLQGPEELAGMTPAQLLQRIRTTSSGVVRTLVENTAEADASARSELWREYFRKTTTMAPRLVEGKDGTIKKATEQQNANFAAEILNRKLIYLQKVTNGSFAVVDPAVLHDADAYARISTIAVEERNQDLPDLQNLDATELQSFIRTRQAEGDAHALDLLSVDAALHPQASTLEALEKAFAHERRALESVSGDMRAGQQRNIREIFDSHLQALVRTVDEAKGLLLNPEQTSNEARMAELRTEYQRHAAELQALGSSDTSALQLRSLKKD